MADFATTTDVEALWRALTDAEESRAEALLPIVSDSLRVEAQRVGKDLDELALVPSFANVLKSVVVDVIARTLMTSTNGEPAIQSTESALGYSQTATFLVPGGGLFIKNTELARLGLRRQRYGTLDQFDVAGTLEGV
jgi:hypothetical protein